MENYIYEDRATMKELIITLIKNWKIILIITLIVSLFGCTYAFILANPVYESEVKGTIFIPESTETKYGVYTFPTSNPQSYLEVAKSKRVLKRTINELAINMSIDSLESVVDISSEKETGLISLTVTASTAEDAQILALTLTDVFIDELNIICKERALDKFIHDFNEQEQIIEEQKILFSQNLKKAEAMFLSQKPIIDDGVINPGYQMLQDKVISLTLTLEELGIKNERNEVLLAELKEKKDEILAYKRKDDLSVLSDGFLDMIKSRISIDQKASFPMKPISPRKLFIITLSIALGFLLSVTIVFFKAYWQNEM